MKTKVVVIANNPIGDGSHKIVARNEDGVTVSIQTKDQSTILSHQVGHEVDVTLGTPVAPKPPTPPTEAPSK